MVKTIQRIINRYLPELISQYHVPQFARVVRMTEVSKQGYNDKFRPFLAVDIQPLDADMKDDSSKPEILAVPVPALSHGNSGGFFAVPGVGSIVTFAFVSGRNDAPVILQVYALNSLCPDLEPQQMKWQYNADCLQQLNKKGDWERKTPGTITDTADTIQQYANELNVTAINESRTIECNSSELVAGVKTLEAYQQFNLFSGATFNISSLGSINQLTNANAITNAGQKITRTAGSDIVDTTQAAYSLTASADITQTTQGAYSINATGNCSIDAQALNAKFQTKADIKAPKVWVGSDAENLLVIVGELHDQVAQLSTQLASHVHNPAQGNVPGNTTSIAAIGAAVIAIKARLTAITG